MVIPHKAIRRWAALLVVLFVALNTIIESQKSARYLRQESNVDVVVELPSSLSTTTTTTERPYIADISEVRDIQNKEPNALELSKDDPFTIESSSNPKSDDHDVVELSSSTSSTTLERLSFADLSQMIDLQSEESKELELSEDKDHSNNRDSSVNPKQDEKDDREDHLKSMEQIRNWRHFFSEQCQDAQTTQDHMMEALSSMFVVEQEKKVKGDSSQQSLVPCNFTFLDFGANVGDSLGKFIDSSLEPCPRKGIFHTPKLDLTTIQYGAEFHKHQQRDNPLVRTARSILHDVHHVPEEYCYVGVEGNPLFTERLHALQQRIHATQPRPVRSAQFLTETVLAGVDGPTVLYLDTINDDKNFWGSSILQGHKDVLKSAAKTTKGSRPKGAPVQGITLSTLFQKTVSKVDGAHALIKMDIEGGEYAVLEEAVESGVLCDYAQSGVTIHLILETHRPDVIGMDNFDLQHWRLVQKTLTTCGIHIHKGRDAGWWMTGTNERTNERVQYLTTSDLKTSSTWHDNKSSQVKSSRT